MDGIRTAWKVEIPGRIRVITTEPQELKIRRLEACRLVRLRQPEVSSGEKRLGRRNKEKEKAAVELSSFYPMCAM